MPPSVTVFNASLASASTAGVITCFEPGRKVSLSVEPRGSTMRGLAMVPSGRAKALKARTIWMGVTAISWPKATEDCV